MRYTVDVLFIEMLYYVSTQRELHQRVDPKMSEALQNYRANKPNRETISRVHSRYKQPLERKLVLMFTQANIMKIITDVKKCLGRKFYGFDQSL